MDRFDYPVRLVPDDGTLLVTSPDFPELTTFGDDEADALLRAGEALRDVIGQYMDRDLDIPAPSSAPTGRKGRAAVRVVALPALLAAKVALWRRVRASGRSLRQVATELDLDNTQLRRLMDPRQASRFDDVERALAALGARVEMTVRPLVRRTGGRETVPVFPAALARQQVELVGAGKFTIAGIKSKRLGKSDTMTVRNAKSGRLADRPARHGASSKKRA